MVFKYFSYYKNLREGYRSPDTFAVNAGIGFIAKFFLLVMGMLLIIGAASLFVGFHFGYLFFKILGFVALGLLILVLLLFRALKKTIRNTARDIKNMVYKKTNHTPPQQQVINIKQAVDKDNASFQ